MSRSKVKRRQLYRRLVSKGRIIIIKEDTLEERFSIGFNIIKLFIFVMVSSISIIAFTTVIIAFTPLREYIPGYSSTSLKKSATQLAIKSDSLELVIRENSHYIESIKKVLKNEFEFAHLSKDSISANATLNVPKIQLEPRQSELKLREYVEQEDKYNLLEKSTFLEKTVLFPPIKGKLIKMFNLKEKQQSVTIQLGMDRSIKATSKGTVIFADWTIENAYVIIIEHKEDIISVYKRCASINKSVGDFVRTGEVIGLGGTTTVSPKNAQLVFELWKNGYPIDPVGLIDFQE